MIPIIDAHHHIWRRDDLPWLSGPIVPRIFGPYEPLRRDYPITEFCGDVAGNNVVASVYVQVNWAKDQAVDEVRWVNSVADQHGWPHAIVSYVDFLSEDAPEVIKRQAEFARVRGVRMQLHWHENELYKFAPIPDQMNVPLFRKNFALLEDYGWSFDLQLFASQMKDGAAFVSAFPNTVFILQHVGMLEDRSSAGRLNWQHELQRLADCPNVMVKISGLGTFIHENSRDHIAYVVGQAIEIFGAERCIFGSNFPIEKLWTDYSSLIRTYREILAEYPPADQKAIFHDNAVRVYRLQTELNPLNDKDNSKNG